MNQTSLIHPIDAMPSAPQYTNLYLKPWVAKDPSQRNFYVNPDVLEVRSHYWDNTTIIPIIATILLAATVFLLIIFKQSPSMVAGTIAACLTIVGVYLILDALKQHRVNYQ